MTNPDDYPAPSAPEPEERPPYFRTWRQWYAAILVELLILILLFRWITVSFE